MLFDLELYLIEILHQTTTFPLVDLQAVRCILSKFYIKPQHFRWGIFKQFVVSYRNSTSNHNFLVILSSVLPVVSYRNSTSNHNGVNATMSGGSVVSYRNSTSNHNGKGWLNRYDAVVSYRNSTSNHNFSAPAIGSVLLYLIEILHQTTTSPKVVHRFSGCILSKFYIKPQQATRV